MTHTKLTTLAATALLAGFSATAWSQGATDPATTPDTTGTDTTGTTDTTRGTGTTGTMDSTRGTGTTGTMDSTRDSSMTGDTSALPATASPLWLLGVLNGAGLMGLAAALRITRRSRRD